MIAIAKLDKMPGAPGVLSGFFFARIKEVPLASDGLAVGESHVCAVWKLRKLLCFPGGYGIVGLSV